MKTQKGNLTAGFAAVVAAAALGVGGGIMLSEANLNKDFKNAVIIQPTDEQEAMRKDGTICNEALVQVYKQVLEEKDKRDVPLAHVKLDGQTSALVSYCKQMKR
ncbi:MAG: hypothetical protein PW788_15775 [Micavibrio sp.]|nr:hypothetical protein [Micavibrio sp.]